MKIRISPFVLCLLLVISHTAYAQPRTDQFVSGAYRFKIDLPATPDDRQRRSFGLLDYYINAEEYFWTGDRKQTVLIGVYRAYKKSPFLTDPEKTSILEAYKKDFIADLQADKVMTSEKPYAAGDRKGVEIYGVDSGRSVTRMFFEGNYLVVISVSKSDVTSFDEQTKLLDTYKPATKEETVAAIKRENSPVPLPQSGAATRPATDLQAKGLKGRVRSVVEEFQASANAERDTVREEFYDLHGSLMGEINYQNGYPQEMTQWGWVDGKRVSSSSVIFLEPSAPKQMPARLGASTGLLGGQTAGDEQYGSRHDITYDDKGRIIEQKVYSPDGSIRFTVKTTYSVTGREIMTTDNTGYFLGRRFEVIDATGKIIEERVLDMSGKPYALQFFTYDLDAAGNWTVRRAQSSTSSAKGLRKAAGITYRTISYY